MWTTAAYIGVFLEGILSFFSPCVLPLLPVYIGLLAGGAEAPLWLSRAQIRRRTFINTLFFIIGISVIFFLLGFSFSAIGKLFADHSLLFMRMGGLFIIFFGLFQWGIFDVSFLMRERRFHPQAHTKSIGPLKAFLLGLAFSFGWTPCVGPALSSVLILAATSQNALTSALLIGLYSLGFLTPFLLLAFFAEKVLHIFTKHPSWLSRVGKISGTILIILGLVVFFGFAGISGSLSPAPDKEASAPAASSAKDDAQKDHPMAPDFTLQGADGKTYRLSDFRGKVVMLNFWATWCPPCRAELPDMEALHQSLNANEMVILSLTLPGGREEEPAGIRRFVEEKGYHFPILFDMDGKVFEAYQIQAFPTSYFIDREGRIFGMAQGALNKKLMEKSFQDAAQYKDKDDA